MWSSAGSERSQCSSFLATNDHFSSNWTSVVRGGKGDQLVVGRLGMLARLAGEAGHGVAVDSHEPLGLADAAALGDVRKQVGGMVKLLAGVIHENLTLPKEIDLGLCSFARGSLYLGFSLPEPGQNDKFLSGDPLVAASREALHTLGQFTGDLDRTDAYEKVVADFPDPMLRDAGLTAVTHIAPSGRRGIETVDLTGKCLPDNRWRHLTIETRQRVKTWLDRPVLSAESITLSGIVREIDLDARRIELRQIESTEVATLRCIYPTGYDREAKSWLDHRLTVTGRVESFQGRPRLMQVDSLQLGR